MYDILKKNSAFFFPYLLALLAGTSFLILWSRIDVSLFINGHHNTVTDFFFTYWTDVGLGWLVIPVAIVLAFISFRYMLMAIICFLITFAVNDGIKFALHYPRPSVILDQLHQSFYHVPGVEVYEWDSFPSGHTAIAFGMFCLLALMATKPGMKFLFFIFAFLVGYSRIYLAEHFITDVMAASVIGVTCAIFTYTLFTNWKAINTFAGIDKPLINLSGK